MRRFIFATLFVFLGGGMAVGTQAQAKTNFVNADIGFYTGGLSLGGGYEYLFDGAQSVGGQLRYFSKSNKRSANGYTMVGAFTGYHFYKKAWDFSLSPGMNIINISPAPRGDSKTTLGPSLSIGLTTQLNDKVAIGFDYFNAWVWFDEDYRGPIVSDLQFKVSVGF